MTALPDFLQLPPEDAARERRRQDRARSDFNSRAKLSPVEEEFGRALILEPTLKQDIELAPTIADKQRLQSRLAELLAAQGRFLEASQSTNDPQAQAFYAKAANAIHLTAQCQCGDVAVAVGQRRLKLPKYRTLMPVYSLKAGHFGFLCECNTCHEWVFADSDPLPANTQESDLDLFKA